MQWKIPFVHTQEEDQTCFLIYVLLLGNVDTPFAFKPVKVRSKYAKVPETILGDLIVAEKKLDDLLRHEDLAPQPARAEDA